MTSANDGDYPVDEVAQAWLIKMRGEESGALREEFDAWLIASADHGEAYRRAERRMAALAVLKTSERHGTDHAEARRGRARGWLPWGAAATAIALLMIAIGAGGAPLPGQPGSASVARAAEPLVTQRGEIRSFRLADGSSATLDTDSRLELAFGDGARSVRLTKGRVRLSIARQNIPLHIEAGRGTTIANDAEIDLRLDEAGTVSAVLRRGDADLRPDAKTGPATALTRGKTLSYRRDGRSQLEVAQAPDIPANWPEGWAEYRSIRLDRLVAEANRYAVIPIVIDDAAIAALDVSGRFHLSETEAFAERIASLFGLSVERSADVT
ncbi:MAG: FecR domain-containing protein [Alphaproteobacteria bacterium]|nr:FecR domain-containing protein [Alphaproteobacteria bacterium]MBU0864541.1 FecR domain-containing protein [Alphaproteobacteria bacterium]MBU1823449.1 FecR domain-containing protein [Alphaproteobacteria bacterium]